MLKSETFNPIIIIPARMNASRFPGKPLKKINGVPMVVKICQQAVETHLAKVIVAAGDKEIYDCIKDYGYEAVLTNPDLPSGTDRVAAAINQYDPHYQYNVIINLQGDLAVFDNEVLEACLNGLRDHPEYDISTVCSLITDPTLINNPNTAKVVIAFKEPHKYGTALYFSRNPCPSGKGDYYQHLGVYGYTRNSLQKFISLPVSSLETRERLEQLRALEAGLKFIITVVKSSPLEVNTKEDLDFILGKLK